MDMNVRKEEDGAPGRIRTSDRLIRSQVLYPTELRARALIVQQNKHIGRLYTCLLYTSPSPRDLSTSRMPSSA